MVKVLNSSGKALTSEQRAKEPERHCDGCGAPIDSFPTDGIIVSRLDSDGNVEGLCHACQWRKYGNAGYVADGTTEKQIDRSMLDP